MGYRVILDTGMTGRDVDFPEATCWCTNDGYLKVGTGGTKYGNIQGEKMGTFNWSKVAGVVDL